MEFSKNTYIELLKNLVRIKSPYFHEDEIMDYVYHWLSANGVESHIHEYYDERITGFHGRNVTGIIDSGKEGPSVFLGGHLDTVTLCDGWTKPPYDGLTVDGKMYGVGAVDMKAGDAALMMNLVNAAEENRNGKFIGKIHFQFASVEEGPFGLGTMFYINDNVDSIAEGVDFAVIAEPSSGFTGADHPCICPGARGGYNYIIRISGKSAHAAIADKGINAIVDASKIITEMENLTELKDEKLGKSTPCIIRINGGGAACSVPDFCEIEVFHHTVRGESEDTIRKGIEAVIESAQIQSDVEMIFRQTPCEGFGGGFDAYCTDENNTFLRKFALSVEESCGKDVSISYFQSIGDFNHFGGKLKVPTILFGPDGSGFHGPDEYVELDSAWEIVLSIDRFIKQNMCI